MLRRQLKLFCFDVVLQKCVSVAVLSWSCFQISEVFSCEKPEDIQGSGSPEDDAFALRIEVEQAEELIRHKIERILHLSDEIIKEANDSESELSLPQDSTDSDIFTEAVAYVTDEAEVIKSLGYTLRLMTMNISYEVQNWTDRIGVTKQPCEPASTQLVTSASEKPSAGVNSDVLRLGE